MRAALLRRFQPRELLTLALLGLAIGCLVDGLGTSVRGAALSVFLPAGLLAALLGWGLGNRRFNGWQAAVSLVALGGILLWGATARLDGPLLLLATSIFPYLVAAFAHWQGGPAPDPARLAASFEALVAQSAGLWQRLALWVTSVSLNVTIDDVVVRVMLWSLTVWLVCAWAGWALRRRDALSALAPALALLAAVSAYTGQAYSSLWLMAMILLALMGLRRYQTNLTRWLQQQIDYAEVITLNSLATLSFLVAFIGILAWGLPAIELKQIIENLRLETEESTAPQSLGLQEAPAESDAPGRSGGQASLPRQHLISAGPNLSEDVVFTVRTGELPAVPVESAAVNAPSHHWRSRTYDVYNGSGWLTSAYETQTLAAGERQFSVLPPGYRLLEQDFFINHADDRNLYWAGALYRAESALEASWRVPPILDSAEAGQPFNEGDLFGALHTGREYRVESYILIASAEQLRAAGQNYPASIRDRYLALPNSVPERVYALARELTATAPTSYDQAVALEYHLRTQYTYTLDLPSPPVGVEVADYFLFELKRGYCDYYATALAVMARSVGLPARLVTGYASGAYDARRAEYLVSAADAHSWVEIYFPGLGWVEFEPTASQPGFNRPQARLPLTAETALPLPGLVESLKASFDLLPPLVQLSLNLLLGIISLLGLYLLGEDLVLRLLPARPALGWMFRNLYRFGGKLTPPTPATTASEFSAALLPYVPNPAALLKLTELYLQALFSAQPVAARLVRRQIGAWRALRWRLLFSRRSPL